MKAPTGVFRVLNYIDEHIFQKKLGNRIPVHKLYEECGVSAEQLDTALKYLQSRLAISSFRETEEYGGFDLIIQARPGLAEYRKFLEMSQKELSKAGPIILQLLPDGDLVRLVYRGKEQPRYAIGSDSNRLKLIRFLVGRDGYTKPEDIALNVKGQDTPHDVQNIRKEIGKICNIAYKKLGITEDKDRTNALIVSRSGSGYQINPKYKIKVLSKD